LGVLRQELLDSGIGREINFPTAADHCTVEYTSDGKGKAIWLTRQAAVDFAAFNEAKFGPQYPYECSTHKHWHLTSQLPYTPGVMVAPDPGRPALAAERVELERESFVLSMPAIELVAGGAIVTLNGERLR
jgi:hypothetical protein